MNNKKLVITLTLTGLLAFGATACDPGGSSAPDQGTAQNKENGQAAGGIAMLLSAQPVHKYSYSQLRQNLQEIQDAQANGTITTAFFMQMGQKDPIYTCPSIGAPIASTDELTNPQQAVSNSDTQSSWATSIGQMDPTGVYTGQSTGTYVMCVGANGQVNPVYWEGDVATVFGAAHWDDTNHKIVIDGPAGSHFTGLKK